MLELLIVLGRAVTLALRGHRELVLENLALRQQLIVMNRATSRLHLQAPDRLFWIALRRLWTNWARRWSSCAPTPSWAGIGTGFVADGFGGRDGERMAGHGSVARSARSSVRWRPPTRCGERPGSTASCGRSASTSRSARCRVS
jgi:hypothetical protein